MGLRYLIGCELVVEGYNIIGEILPLHGFIGLIFCRQRIDPPTNTTIIATVRLLNRIVRVHISFAYLTSDYSFASITNLRNTP